ncbi:hypothetical protein ACWCXS_24865 [Streptomyces sp. NPDC001685]
MTPDLLPETPGTRPARRPGERRAPRRDLYAAGAAVLLFAVAAVAGTVVEHRDATLHVKWPPLLATWHPHAGPGTPAALLVAVAVVAYGPALATRLPWHRLLAAVWGAALAWTWSLALVDGWQRGVAGRLTTRHEYLRAVGSFQDIPATLRDFTGHILLGTPDHWPAHVAGHPPAATLTFVFLDRAGLGGGAWAGAWCITLGTTAAVAVLVAVRALASERHARRAAPFLVLVPGAVWLGTSADAYFAAVAAWALAFLALAVTGHRTRPAGLAAGLLAGLAVYLSYGLTLLVVIGAAVLWLGPAQLRALPFVLAGCAVVPLVFTAFGFYWWDAYDLLVTRYHQGVGGERPQVYWVWANLACLVAVVGVATVAGLRRAGGFLVRRERTDDARLAVLVLAALAALLVADLSGMSKAETERIWLPFALWLLPATAFLTGARGWLAAQALLALTVNHLLLTGW